MARISHQAMRRDILIIKLGALGDVVMATGLVERILRHHAPRRCVLLTSPPYGELFSAWTGLELKTFDRSSLRSTLATVRWIRRQRFRRVYDLQSNDRTGVMCGLSAIPERVGNHPRFPYNLHPQGRYTGQCHIHDRMLEVLEAAGISADAGRPLPATPPTAGPGKSRRVWLQERDLAGRKLVIMHAGASARRPEKRWPYFRELAEALAQRGFLTLWAGGEEDRRANADLARVTGADATGAFSSPATGCPHGLRPLRSNQRFGPHAPAGLRFHPRLRPVRPERLAPQPRGGATRTRPVVEQGRACIPNNQTGGT